jgi:DNA-directed RNA polymerase specialized sigma24 family protein
VTEEDRWICCAQAGDHDAFRHLWEAHHAVAMAAALRLCHHRGLAEDITQGAFVLAWRGLPRFRRGAPFRPWLLRIVFRHALDVMEQQRLSHQAVSLDLLLQEDGRTQAAIVSMRRIFPHNLRNGNWCGWRWYLSRLSSGGWSRCAMGLI